MQSTRPLRTKAGPARGRLSLWRPNLMATAALLATAALAGTPMQRVLLENSKAIDGSPALYYGDQNASSTKYVIWLQGGGLCQSQADCQGRANSPLGSSKSFPQTFEDYQDCNIGNLRV